MKTTTRNILLSQSFSIKVTLFDVEFCPLEIWIRPWIKCFTLIGFERDNFMFHVFYLEFSRDIHKRKRIKIEILGIKNFKWAEI